MRLARKPSALKTGGLFLVLFAGLRGFAKIHSNVKMRLTELMTVMCTRWVSYEVAT